MRFDIQHAKLTECAARDVGRYAINGICIHTEKGGVAASATNGRVLVSVPVTLADGNTDGEPADTKQSHIVPTKAWQAAVRNRQAKKRRPDPAMTLGDKAVTVGENGDRTEHSYVTGEFPDVQGVLPSAASLKTKYKHVATINADLLASISAALHDRGEISCVQLFVNLEKTGATNAAIIVTREKIPSDGLVIGRDAFGLLMPMTTS